MTQEYCSQNDFTGSDSERIHQAIQAAAGSCGRVVVPRLNQRGGEETTCWLLDCAILLPGDMVLELHNCHLKLSDACRDNFIRSANFVLDARVLCNITENLTVRLIVKNALNREYSGRPGDIQPPRNISLRLTADF